MGSDGITVWAGVACADPKRDLGHSSSVQCSITWAFWATPWPSFKHPVFSLAHLSGLLHFCGCSAFSSSFLPGLLTLFPAFKDWAFPSLICHLCETWLSGTEGFHEMGQGTGLSDMMDCSWTSWLLVLSLDHQSPQSLSCLSDYGWNKTIRK